MADKRLALEAHAGDMDAPDGVTATEWEATPASVKKQMQRLALEVVGLRRELELVSRAYANREMSQNCAVSSCIFVQVTLMFKKLLFFSFFSL